MSMEVIYVNDKVAPVIPSLNFSTIRAEIEDFPCRSYKHLDYCLRRKGYRVKEDLPGVDDEILVAEMLNCNLSWLEA